MRLLLLLLLATTARAAALDDYFDRAAAHGFSGAVLIARGDEVLLRRGYGFADRQRGIAATTETAFDIASLDKQFLAAAILRLEEEGKLKTGDPLSRFFENLPADKRDITLHQVLSHTAGFGDEYWDSYPGHTRAQFLAEVLAKPLAHPAGQFDYASFDYWLIEEVIERVSGLPFEAYLRRELWQPAGMEHTGFALPRWDDARVARYTLWTVPPEKLPGILRWPDPRQRVDGWRSLLSTPEDLARWWRALRDGRVLTPASRARLFTPVLQGYAYGWNVTTTARGTRLVHHGGAGNGISLVTFRWFVEEDTFVVICNNSLNGDFAMDYVLSDVEALLFGGLGSMPSPVTARVPEGAWAGRYRLPSGGLIEIIQPAGGPLVVRSFDAGGIVALSFGGVAADGARLLSTAFVYEGEPEIQVYSRTAGGGVLRTIVGPSGPPQRDEQRMPAGIEAVLAPAPGGGFTTWNFRLRTAVRVTFDGQGLHLRGANGEVVAARLAKEN
jgi:CubicO group peptidase (beta-lactamase class C family)